MLLARVLMLALWLQRMKCSLQRLTVNEIVRLLRSILVEAYRGSSHKRYPVFDLVTRACRGAQN
jgi:hypothetical protein